MISPSEILLQLIILRLINIWEFGTSSTDFLSFIKETQITMSMPNIKRSMIKILVSKIFTLEMENKPPLKEKPLLTMEKMSLISD